MIELNLGVRERDFTCPAVLRRPPATGVTWPIRRGRGGAPTARHESRIAPDLR